MIKIAVKENILGEHRYSHIKQIMLKLGFVRAYIIFPDVTRNFLITSLDQSNDDTHLMDGHVCLSRPFQKLIGNHQILIWGGYDWECYFLGTLLHSSINVEVKHISIISVSGSEITNSSSSISRPSGQTP